MTVASIQDLALFPRLGRRSYSLSCRFYEPNDHAELADFDCGCLEYEIEIAEWIRDEKQGCISDHLQSGRAEQVWIYSLKEEYPTREQIIAYGAPAKEQWDSVLPDIGSIEVSMIAMVGLRRDYQGKPEGADRSERFSTLILEDLVAKAAKRATSILGKRIIGLYVHPENIRAISLYERLGFSRLERVTWLHPEFKKVYHGMVLVL